MTSAELFETRVGIAPADPNSTSLHSFGSEFERGCRSRWLDGFGLVPVARLEMLVFLVLEDEETPDDEELERLFISLLAVSENIEQKS